MNSQGFSHQNDDDIIFNTCWLVDWRFFVNFILYHFVGRRFGLEHGSLEGQDVGETKQTTDMMVQLVCNGNESQVDLPLGHHWWDRTCNQSQAHFAAHCQCPPLLARWMLEEWASICQKNARKVCHIACQKECQKTSQTECHMCIVCEIECQKVCQIECQKVCQIECHQKSQIQCRRECQLLFLIWHTIWHMECQNMVRWHVGHCTS